MSAARTSNTIVYKDTFISLSLFVVSTLQQDQIASFHLFPHCCIRCARGSVQLPSEGFLGSDDSQLLGGKWPPKKQRSELYADR